MNKQMNPVGWFEIPVADMARAKVFYEDVVGATFEDHQVGPVQMAWFMPMEMEAYGACGSLVQGGCCQPGAQGVLVYFTAPDLAATLKKAQEKGGTLIMDKTAIGEHGFIGIVQDTEGNYIGLHSMQG